VSSRLERGHPRKRGFYTAADLGDRQARGGLVIHSDSNANHLMPLCGSTGQKVRMALDFKRFSLAYESGGQGFESSPVRQCFQQLNKFIALAAAA
jgi:hypothetical protein